MDSFENGKTEDVLVSVVIPVYNAEMYLDKCMNDILHQTLTHLEIICVDDGSTDQSSKMLDSYANTDDRVRVLHQKNAGPGAARNCGLQQASGEYLIFLDADDRFEPDFLEVLLKKAEHTHADVVICDSDSFRTGVGTISTAGKKLKMEFVPGDCFSPEDIGKRIFQLSNGWSWDKLYRTDFVKKNELDFPELKNSEDLVFVLFSLALAKTIAVSDAVLVHHRINRSTSVSNSIYRSIDAPVQAVLLLRQRLVDKCLYERYEQSFLNWSMDFLTWNAANLGYGAPGRCFYQTLKKKWFAALQFKAHSRAYYFDRRIYLRYVLIRHAPYPVFILIVLLNRHLKTCRERRYHDFKKRKQILSAGRAGDIKRIPKHMQKT